MACSVQQLIELSIYIYLMPSKIQAGKRTVGVSRSMQSLQRNAKKDKEITTTPEHSLTCKLRSSPFKGSFENQVFLHANYIK